MSKRTKRKSDIINGVFLMASDEKAKSSKSIKDLLGDSKQKIISRKKEKDSKNSDLQKVTIGKRLISEILESKKVVIERIEISKQAMENLQKQSKLKNVPVEQIISNLVEQNFNPKYQK
ncbi:MAG: hypothetical protein N3A69_05905 [Leptospiraceae bacterium]|nr:hypothetical protein [Leptospiraceae bacterium]